MKNVFKAIFRHKIISAILILLIAAGGYFGYKRLSNKGEGTQYVLAAVTKDTLIVSVSGSGQVSALDQVDVKSKTAGEVLYVGAVNGQKVKSGTLLAKIDDSDAQTAVKDAETSYQQAQLDLEKMKGITNDLGSIQGIKDKATADLQNSYQTTFNNISNVFVDLPTIMSGLHDMFYLTTLGSWGQLNIDYYVSVLKTYNSDATQLRDNINSSYNQVNEAYNKNLTDYRSVSIFSDGESIEQLTNETTETLKKFSDLIKITSDFIRLYQTELKNNDLVPQSSSNTNLSTLNTYAGKINGYLSTLLANTNTVQANKESLAETEYTIADQEDKVAAAEKTLDDAKKKLEDYSIYAPFDGVVAEVNVKTGDSVSLNASITTLITEQQIGEITLNEVDVAKVKVGQKVTLTFDALSEVSISGKVLEVDSIGTASQGVVSYGVEIGFDTQDERVKPGMSVTADIITDVKQDILVLPNSAVKSQGDSKYVELVEASDDIKQKLLASVSGVTLPSSPKQQSIETGLSNDTSTEIVSGLNEGDVVVTSTVSSSTSSNPGTTRSNQTQIRIPGVGGLEGGR
jgi:HlyD family secretion protein